MVRIGIIIALLWLCFTGKAQKVDAFAQAKSNRSSVLLEQPLKVTVTVFTATWFTQPLQIENLQVDGAFVQSFKQTQSAIKYVGKKKFAALEFYYIVFPYRDGELEFPALNIITETPAVGDFKGKQVKLTTKALKINVKPIPKDADAEHWLVASNARISGKWNQSINSLQVGDVLKRSITISANGTLPSFIDEPQIDDVPFGNIYRSEPKYFDDRDNKSVNGRRIDTYSYLLEKKGAFTIPEVELTWYNPYVGKFYKRKLPEVKINIVENADMASLVSLRDSLNALNPVLVNEELRQEEEADFKKWAWLAVCGILGLFMIYIITKIGVKISASIKSKKAQYKNSEAFWFKKLMSESDEKAFLKVIYQWLDHSGFKMKNKTISRFVEENKSAHESFQKLKKNNYSKESPQTIKLNEVKSDTKILRERYKAYVTLADVKTSSLINEINP
ncbi:hypothetical protein [Carboxylicivirga sp. N1Y90]|uniref:hypothetical protein n=1 Tax=Carboxylicivirga fragile TaxID=3417571 RepID=UPI003D3394D4|nr:BatD family protein [Marinilabiliaceae bacterium N1Y90]